MLLFGVLKDITTEKLESRPEHYMAIIGVISFIILGKTQDSENFRTNHSIEGSLCHRKGYLKVLGRIKPYDIFD